MKTKIKNEFEKKYFKKCLFYAAKEIEYENFDIYSEIKMKFINAFYEYVKYYILKTIQENFHSIQNSFKDLKNFGYTPLKLKEEIYKEYLEKIDILKENIFICKDKKVFSINYKDEDKILNIYSFEILKDTEKTFIAKFSSYFLIDKVRRLVNEYNLEIIDEDIKSDYSGCKIIYKFTVKGDSFTLKCFSDHFEDFLKIHKNY